MFIGSSVEGKSVAETLQVGLEYDVETTIWHQGVFGLSQGSLESLVSAANDYDFATLILTPDDLTRKRKSNVGCPRDNVVFELGLFMGALGRDRTFIVYNRDVSIDLPSDLAGVTAATFPDRADNNLQAAIGSVCTKIKIAIEACGFSPPKTTNITVTSSEVEYKQGVYWTGGDDGPFCTTCYDTNKEFIRLTEFTGHFKTFGKWKCNKCKAHYGGH